MATVAELVVEIKSKADQVKRDVPELTKLIAALEKEIAKANKAPISPKSDQAAKAAQRLADAQRRVALASADAAGKVRILEQALEGEAAGTERALRIEEQLITARQRLARETAKLAKEEERRNRGGGGGTSPALPRTFAGFTGQGLAEIGGLFAGSAVLQFAVDAGKAANELERVQATLRAVAGSQEQYDRIVQLATQNQRLFGGTLAENLSTFQQFQFIANRTGADLAKLNQVAALLATVNPAEGFQGAGFSLGEFFSGDLTSIVERFNLPRTELRALLNEGRDAAGILEGITDILAKQGITADTLTASLDTTAQTYRELGAAVDTATTAIGSRLTASFEQAASGATRLLEALNGNAEALAEIRAAVGDGIVTEEDLAGARRDIANDRARQLTGGGSQRTESQANAAFFGAGEDLAQTRELIAQILIDTPELTSEVERLAAAFGETRDVEAFVNGLIALRNEAGLVIGAQQGVAEAVANNSAVLGTLAADLQLASEAGGGFAIGANNIAQSLIAGTITADEAAAALAFLTQQLQSGTDATDENTSATTLAAIAQLEQQVAAQSAKDEQERLNDALRDSIAAGGDAEAIAARVADALGIEADEALRATNAQLALNSARQGGSGAASLRGVGGGRSFGNDNGRGRGGSQAGPFSAVAAAEARAYQEQLDRIAQLEQEAQRQSERTQGQANRRRESDLKRRASSASKALSDEQKAAEKAAREREKLDERTARRLIDIQEAYRDDVLDAEEAYQERLLSIAEDFAEKRADAEKKFSDDQFASRASFYQRVAGLDASQRTGVIQEFEAAQQEAARIAVEQGADVASEYLAEIQQIILDRAARQAEIAELLKDGQADEAEFLSGVDAIVTAEEQRRLDDILRGEDSIASEEQAALADNEQQRLDDLSQAEQDLADARADANADYLEGLGLENEALAEQLRLLGELATLGGGAAQSALPPLPAATTAAAPSSETGVLLVRDDSLIRTTVDSLRRVEDRVGLVEQAATATRDATARVIGAIDSLRGRFGGTGG